MRQIFLAQTLKDFYFLFFSFKREYLLEVLIKREECNLKRICPVFKPAKPFTFEVVSFALYWISNCLCFYQDKIAFNKQTTLEKNKKTYFIKKFIVYWFFILHFILNKLNKNINLQFRVCCDNYSIFGSTAKNF